MNKQFGTGFQAEYASDSGTVAEAIALRGRVFRNASRPDADRDAFDAACDHIVVRRVANGRVVCSLRVKSFDAARDVASGYSAQFYDLQRLHDVKGPIVEVGRFCVLPDLANSEVLYSAWGALASYAGAVDAAILIGCSSFPGANPERHTASLRYIWSHHAAPEQWRPGLRHDQTIGLNDLEEAEPNRRMAVLQMPPLLRSYLSMGAWVSDHAVIDRDLDTLHVFTGLEVARIPGARKDVLRKAAAIFEHNRSTHERLVNWPA